ncbi:MAG: NAD kinase [Bacteroidota bacterium]
MKVAVHGKEFSPENADAIQLFFDMIDAKQGSKFISNDFLDILKQSSINIGEYNSFGRGEDLGYADIMFTLGGDGTLLDAITYIAGGNVPILGINTGRLGFLATISKESIASALDAVFEGAFTYDERTLVSLSSDQNLFNGVNFGLNDFTILKRDSSSMIVVHTYINGEFLNSYWADGLIVSTPTGSTGYSLSCGGPLVLPQSNNFILTPVSPHNLTVRPLVVSDDCEISFKIEGRSNNFLISLDSRFEIVDASVNLTVNKASFRARLVKLNNSSIFDTLRQKLNWGLDVRN